LGGGFIGPLMDDVVVTIKEPKKKIEESQKEQLVRQLELGLDYVGLDCCSSNQSVLVVQ